MIFKASPKGVILESSLKKEVEHNLFNFSDEDLELLKKPINWRFFENINEIYIQRLYFYLVLNGKIKELEKAGFPRIKSLNELPEKLENSQVYAPYLKIEERIKEEFNKKIRSSTINKINELVKKGPFYNFSLNNSFFQLRV